MRILDAEPGRQHATVAPAKSNDWGIGGIGIFYLDVVD
jgi:hypothetical protein